MQHMQVYFHVGRRTREMTSSITACSPAQEPCFGQSEEHFMPQVTNSRQEGDEHTIAVLVGIYT